MKKQLVGFFLGWALLAVAGSAAAKGPKWQVAACSIRNVLVDPGNVPLEDAMASMNQLPWMHPIAPRPGDPASPEIPASGLILQDAFPEKYHLGRKGPETRIALPPDVDGKIVFAIIDEGYQSFADARGAQAGEFAVYRVTLYGPGGGRLTTASAIGFKGTVVDTWGFSAQGHESETVPNFDGILAEIARQAKCSN